MKSKKVLLINEAFFPDESGSAQYLLDVAKTLSEQGASITVLTGGHGYLDRDAKFKSEDEILGMKVIRIPPFPLKGGGRLLKIIKALWVNFFFALKMATLGRFDVGVVLTSPPLISVLASQFLRCNSLVYWTMDINPDQSVAAGWIRKDGILHKILDTLHETVLKRAALIVVLDDHMKSLLVSKGAPKEKISVQHLWPIVGFKNANPKLFRERLGAIETKLIMYSGNLGVCNPLISLIDAARELEKDPNIKFVISGSGSKEELLKKEVSAKGLKNVLFLPYTQREDLASKLEAADIHVVSMAKEYTGIIHPSKIYAILSAGKPFIFLGPKESFIYERLVKEGLGSRVDENDANGVIVAILEEIKKSSDEKLILERKRREVASSFGSPESLSREILSL